MCWWDSQLVPYVIPLFEVTRNVSGILPTAWSEFITALFASSGKTSTTESAATMGKYEFNKCWLEQPEFSLLKATPNDKFEEQCTLCKTTLKLGTLGVKVLVSHTKLQKHQLASKSLQQSHTITHFYTRLSQVPCPSSSTSARPELCAFSAVSHSSDIQTIFLTWTLKVEVLWILNTVQMFR